MKTSDEINLIAKALIQAQGLIEPAVKSSENPFFKKGGKNTTYADLTSYIEVAMPALQKSGLALVQFSEPSEKLGYTVVGTRLIHESGQWIQSVFEAPMPKNDPQGVGSAVTYLRRYGLAAILCIPANDDDGNAASHQKPVAVGEPIQTENGFVDSPETQSEINKVMHEFGNICRSLGLTKRSQAILFNAGVGIPYNPTLEKANALLDAALDFKERKDSGSLDDKELSHLTSKGVAA